MRRVPLRVGPTVVAGALALSLAVLSPLTPWAGAAKSSTVHPGQTVNTVTHAHLAIPAFSLRLEDQFLAVLKYLPVKFVPKVARTTPPTTTTTTTTTTTVPVTTTTGTGTTSTTTTTTTTTTTVPAKKPAKPVKVVLSKYVAGSFVWRFPSLPAVLRRQWRVGTDNVIVTGALKKFQLDHGLTTTGAIDSATWVALVTAVAQRKVDPSGYNYVLVSQTLPEKLKLYANGRHIYTTYVNTGVSAAPTAAGTYPVYSRFLTTTMSGTLPDGKTYDDTGIPWVSYFHGGDALHGFIRSSYGYPQSLGCVEMPFTHAQFVFPYTPIGTLVTVE